MRSIKGTLTKELNDFVGIQHIAKSKAIIISSFRKLMLHVARLAYLNKDYLLFFRGQDRDYKNKAGASTIYPSIYRGERISKNQLSLSFDILNSASKRLCDAFLLNKLEGHHDVRRRKYIQWSILQHYSVCSTPLLDLTHNLRVACSFALLDSNKRNPYVYVFGLPYFTNRISLNSEHDIVNIRLLSICPPDALRPYFQEGYLAGTDEITTEYDRKDELDFNNRLIAKFKLLREKKFWSPGFGAIPKSILFPDGDNVEKICMQIKNDIGTEVEPSTLGKFLREWTDLEYIILTTARRYRDKVFSIREALIILSKENLVTYEFLTRLEKLRLIRNRAVHEPRKLELNELAFALSELDELKKQSDILV